MHQVGFEAIIPVFEWPTTFHALDRATTVTGSFHYFNQINYRVKLEFHHYFA
jgi:hypothetical protein